LRKYEPVKKRNSTSPTAKIKFDFGQFNTTDIASPQHNQTFYNADINSRNEAHTFQQSGSSPKQMYYKS